MTAGADAFETQCFLSYSHADNESLVKGRQGWIDDFQHILKVRLGELLGHEPKIWWDHSKLRGNQVFGGVIEEGLSRSSVLVPVVSPSYRNSEWCRKELRAFCAAAEKSNYPHNAKGNRIFKVIKTPLPEGKQPDPLPQLLGYDFFRTDPVSGKMREFRLLDASREYLQKIDDLAYDIRIFLEGQKSLQAGIERSEKAVLYLAESSHDLAAERDRVKRSLRQRGYMLFPDRPLPTNGPALRKLVRECLQRSRLSIHLIGANYGTIPEAETTSIIAIQNELAAERSADSGFCRLVWMPPGLKPADERQRKFVERLHDDSEAQRGAEILPTTLEDLETIIEDKLRGQEETKAAPSGGANGGNGLRYIYLICDQRDLEEAEALRDFFYDLDERLDINLPLFEGDESEVRAYHKDNLTTCHGVLLYFGLARESWLRTKLLDLRKAAGYGRSRPLDAKAVYMAPPPGHALQRFRTREALVLEESGQPSAKVLAPFLQQLGLEVT